MLILDSYKYVLKLLSLVLIIINCIAVNNSQAQNIDIHSSYLTLEDEYIKRDIDSLFDLDILKTYDYCEKEISQITYFEKPALYSYIILKQSATAYQIGNTVLADSLKNILFSIKLDNIHPVIRGDILLYQSMLADVYKDNINAIKYGKKALAIFDNNRITKKIGKVNQILGSVYYSMGKDLVSYSHYTDALEVFKKACFLKEYSYTLLSSIRALDNLKEYKIIHDYISIAEENAIALNDQRLLGMVFYYSANYYLGHQNYGTAIQLYNKAEQIFIKENIIVKLSILYTKRAYISGRLGDFKEAIEYNKKADSIREQKHSKLLRASSQYNIASSFIGLKMNDSALYYINKGEEMYSIYNLDIYSLRALDLRIKIHVSRNQFDMAFQSLEEKMKLQEQFFKSHNDKRFKEMKTDYQMGQFEENKKLKLAEVKMHKTLLKRDQVIFRVVLFIQILVFILGLLYFFYDKSKNERNIVLTNQKIIYLQLNSHFIFNALTGIQSLIFQKKVESAIHHLTVFSNLINRIINETQKKYIPLINDILFIKDFLKLQDLRFGDIIKYQLNIDDKLDLRHMMVPPMLIYPFIEYAVEECVQRSKGKGEFIINIKNEKKYIIYELIDKGLGYIDLDLCFIKRYAGQEVLCCQLNKERLSIYNRFYKTKIIFAKNTVVIDNEEYNSLNFRIKK